MPCIDLDKGNIPCNAAWEGNNVGFTCPHHKTVFIVSGEIHPEEGGNREVGCNYCPALGCTTAGRVWGGRKSVGYACACLGRPATRRDCRQHRKQPDFFEQEMMHSPAYPPERVSLCAIAAALVLSVLLSGPAAGITQRHCPTKPHTGRHDGADGRKGKQMLVRRVDVSRRQGQNMGTPRRVRDRYGISIELGGSEPVGN